MKKLSLHKDQRGVVAFFITMIVMVILTLIVLAFAQMVRREQRQTLDRQLNLQAFYAAESGINDAREALKNAPITSPLRTNDYTADCDAFIGAASLTSTIDPNVSYSCLLVDSTPTELRFSSVPTTESVTTPIIADSGTIDRLQISWEDNAQGTDVADCPTAGQYPPSYAGLTCDVGMLRIELVPFNNATSRDDLIRNRAIAFLQPWRGAGGVAAFSFATASFDNQGRRHVAVCNNTGPRLCTVDITGLSLTNGFLRMRSLYRNTAVTVRAYSGANPIELAGSQAEIDATGKASDILKRIKVSLPIPVEGDPASEFALQSTKTICKRLIVTNTTGVDWANGNLANSPCNPQQTVN